MTDAEDRLTDALDVLTPKQRKWAEAYAGVACGNGVKACELAGYSGTYSTMAVQAHHNIRNPKIIYVLEMLQESDPLVMGRSERLRTLSRIARGDESEEKVTATGEVVVARASLSDRMKAIEALSKAAGEHIPKKTDGTGSLPVELTIEQLLELAQHGKAK
jgi:phage terminase small subunit